MKATLLAAAALVLGCLIGYGLTRREFAREVLPLDITPASAGPGAAAGKIGPKAVVVNSEHHDFGSMDRNEHGTHAFVIRNDGDAPLTLVTGKTTCKCTVFAAAQDRHVLALVNPFEKDLKDAESAVADDRTWPKNRDIQTLPRVFAAQDFSG